MRPTHRVLVYYHIPEYVDRYAKLLKKNRKDIDLIVCKNEEQINRSIGKAEILFSGSSFPVKYISKAKNLKWIQSMSAGVENFIRSKVIPPQVVITKPKGIFGPSMAEYIIGYILAISQSMKRIFENQKRRYWQPFVVETIRDKTVGIMGLGSVGAYIAYKLHLLGVEVIGFEEQERSLPFIKREYTSKEIDEFLSISDFVILTLPLTDRTVGLLGKKQLACMKKSAYLINISRGPLVQEEALLNALRRGKIAGAILDVFDKEPLPEEHPLWNMENVIITPHISAPSLPEDLANIFLENLKRFEEGKHLIGIVDRTLGY
jgi:phosphoglycerate dehydrogenase-like enzyme